MKKTGKLKSNKKTLNWIYKRIKRFIPIIGLIAVFNILCSLALIALATISKDVINAGVQKSTGKIFMTGAFLFAFIVLQILINNLTSVLNVRTSGKMTISMRDYMFSSVLRKKYPGIFDHHSGDLLNRFTTDIDQVVTGALHIIPDACAMLSKIIAGLGSLFVQNYIFALIILFTGFFLPLIGRKISKSYKFVQKEVSRTEGLSRSFLQECFANIVVIKTFESEKPVLNKLNEYMDINLKFRMKRIFITVFITVCLNSFFTFGYYGVLVWGATQIATGAITYGSLYYYLQLISILRSPLQSVSGIIPQYYSMIASAERLIELEDIGDEASAVASDTLKELKENFENITVSSMSFGYGNETVLKNCHFNIQRGKITAITGESGSGKSTLFKILLGLYEPTSGSVKFNGKIPIDASTRGMFSYVPQGNMILSCTIKENLTLCDPDVSDEQIERAAKAADIYDFIMTLPDKFDTKLSERGAGLSEGQIQRISIARALLFDAPILLLDESTSALDEQTETAVLSNIKSMTDKTVIFITHRNTSITVCDNIIHVENKEFVRIK